MFMYMYIRTYICVYALSLCLPVLMALGLRARPVEMPEGRVWVASVPSPLQSSCREGSCPAMVMVLAVLRGLADIPQWFHS